MPGPPPRPGFPAGGSRGQQLLGPSGHGHGRLGNAARRLGPDGGKGRGRSRGGASRCAWVWEASRSRGPRLERWLLRTQTPEGPGAACHATAGRAGPGRAGREAAAGDSRERWLQPPREGQRGRVRGWGCLGCRAPGPGVIRAGG